MMKRCKGATGHTGVWIIKNGGRDLIPHTRPQLLWRRRRRWCCKRGTLLSKITSKLRVKPHVRCASIGSKQLRWIKAFIACIVLLKRCRGVTLSFFGARRRSLISIESFLDFLHIFLELLAGFPLLMKPSFNGMVRVTHAKQEPEHFFSKGRRFSLAAGPKTVLVQSYLSDQFLCCLLPLRSRICSRRRGDLSWRYERLFGGIRSKGHVLAFL
jgi:hypothetical protein